MAKVIVFEKDGNVRLANLINDYERVCRQNLTDIIPCPQEVLNLVPKVIADFCKETAPHYLYRNAEGDWESAEDTSV